MSPVLRRLRPRREPPAPSEVPDPELRTAINVVLHRTLTPIVGGLVVLYLGFTVAHAFLLPADLAPLMASLSFGSAAILWGLLAYARQLPPTSAEGHAVAATATAIVLVNSVMHLHLTGEPRQATNLLLLIMAAGFLLLSSRWYAAMLAATLVAWLAVFSMLPRTDDWFHYGFAVIEASAISIVIHVLRVQTTRRAERLRLQAVQQQAELQVAKEAAEEMARLKSAFLTSMSHEIRTPLTSIIGFAEVLHADAEGTPRELAGVIHGSGLRLLDTLNSVLDFARLEASRVALQAEVIDVAAAVAPTIQLLEPLARKKGLILSAEFPPEPAWARVDPSALHRMLNNLVGNAIKFTEEGGVTVAVDATAHVVQVRVADTGVGIDPGFAPHLFDEFRQESTGLARSHEGSGLGLAITHRLVELAGGSIAVESAKGVGSTFTLTFPRVEAP